MNRDSHGLKVARMAGMPPSVIETATAAFAWMDASEGQFMADKQALGQLGVRLAEGVSRLNAVTVMKSVDSVEP